MAQSVGRSIVVPVVADTEPIEWQLTVIKDMLIQLSEAIDNAIQSLQETRNNA